MKWNKQQGQGIVEYAGALVIAAIIVGVAVAFAWDGFINDLYTFVEGRINAAIQS